MKKIVKLGILAVFVVVFSVSIAIWEFLNIYNTISLSKPPKTTPKTTIVTTISQTEPMIITIPLLGEDKLSDGVNIDTFPSGWKYVIEGHPEGTTAKFGNEKPILLPADIGIKGGIVRFSGPIGKEVKIRFSPAI